MWEKMVRQFEYETAGWKRLLSFLKDENVHLRNRLADVVSEDMNGTLLEKAENLQAGFSNIDEIINWLAGEVFFQERLLQRESFPGAEQLRKILKGQEELRKNSIKAEELFHATRNEFREFVEACYSGQHV